MQREPSTLEIFQDLGLSELGGGFGVLLLYSKQGPGAAGVVQRSCPGFGATPNPNFTCQAAAKRARDIGLGQSGALTISAPRLGFRV